MAWQHEHPIERRRNQHRYISTIRGRYRQLKESATRHKRLLEITFSEFVEWRNAQPKICYYCGNLLRLGGRERDCLTTDRMNNEGNYTLDNIVLACVSCNTKKGNKERLLIKKPVTAGRL